MQKLESLRFLVVDDMLTMRKIVSHQLKSLGITATVNGAATAGTAENAQLTFTAAVNGTKVDHVRAAIFQ